MKVKVDGFVHECESAKRTKTAVILTMKHEDKVYTKTLSGCDVVETAEVIEGAWEHDSLAEPSITDWIEAQVTYTAMMTDTLLGV